MKYPKSIFPHDSDPRFARLAPRCGQMPQKWAGQNHRTCKESPQLLRSKGPDLQESAVWRPGIHILCQRAVFTYQPTCRFNTLHLGIQVRCFSQLIFEMWWPKKIILINCSDLLSKKCSAFWQLTLEPYGDVCHEDEASLALSIAVHSGQFNLWRNMSTLLLFS